MVEVRNGVPFGELDEPAMDGTYMTVREFAEAKGVSEALVRQWKKRGIIDGINYEGRALIRAKTQIRLKKLRKQHEKLFK